jgi:hypothetical protein
VSDPVLAQLIQEAEHDPATVGLLIQGSRAADAADAESDYDFVWVLDDAELARRERTGLPLHVKEQRDDALLDIVFTSFDRLRKAVDEPGWWSSGLAGSRLLVGKTKEVGELHRALVEMTEKRARQQAAEWFDGYLNSFYRSLKAWRRGDELAGRIEAAESVMQLARTLFALERTWAPYPNRLRAQLPALERQGWPAGYLEAALVEIVKTGDPALQQELEGRVETLLRKRGFGAVVEDWGGEIERVKGFRFEAMASDAR